MASEGGKERSLPDKAVDRSHVWTKNCKPLLKLQTGSMKCQTTSTDVLVS